jgi:hypothetical protein
MVEGTAPDGFVLPAVREVLALPELQHGTPQVVAGAAGLDRKVRWLHVSACAHLDHGRNKSAAADAFHQSRPAFYHRLATIERVLEVDLDSVESCLSLHVALLALDVLRDATGAPRPR